MDFGDTLDQTLFQTNKSNPRLHLELIKNSDFYLIFRGFLKKTLMIKEKSYSTNGCFT